MKSVHYIMQVEVLLKYIRSDNEQKMILHVGHIDPTSEHTDDDCEHLLNPYSKIESVIYSF